MKLNGHGQVVAKRHTTGRMYLGTAVANVLLRTWVRMSKGEWLVGEGRRGCVFLRVLFMTPSMSGPKKQPHCKDSNDKKQ
jgi:hypothetical protein